MMAKAWHMGEALHEIIGDGVPATQQAATKLGVSYQTVYRWYARPVLAERIVDNAADVLGCNAEWIQTGKGERYESGRGMTKGEKAAERLLLVYQAEIARISTRLMKDIVAVLEAQ